jgi:hypothetical protein
METMTKRHCCDDDDDWSHCASGSRNRYFRRKMMTAEDFAREQAYMIGRRRLLNRALHGWGVVFGYGVWIEAGRLGVDCGLGLDEHGREIFEPERRRLKRSELFVRVEGHCHPGHAPELTEGRWLLSAHYAERLIDPVRLADDCGDCTRPEWNRICETVRYSLTRVEEECCPSHEPGCPEDCGCPPPACAEHDEPHDRPQQEPYDRPKQEPHDRPRQEPRPPYDQRPQQHREDMIQQATADSREQRQRAPNDRPPQPPQAPPRGEDPPATLAPYPRGPHHTLCCWSRDADVACEDGHLCEWDDVCLDSHDGVPLACLEITDIDECGDPVFGAVEDCPPRRLVKRSDMLFDLIRGCDLTRIVDVSWARWAQLSFVSWEEFRANFEDTETAGLDPENECLTGLDITFSRPVKTSTLRPDVVTITAHFRETSSGWSVPYRVPVVRLQWAPPDAGDPPDTTRRATVIVRRNWFRDEIEDVRREDSKFDVDYGRPNRYPHVTVEIDGHRMRDCAEQPVDADSCGPEIVPTGNGTPGGICRFTFHVAPAQPASRRDRS